VNTKKLAPVVGAFFAPRVLSNFADPGTILADYPKMVGLGAAGVTGLAAYSGEIAKGAAKHAPAALSKIRAAVTRQRYRDLVSLVKRNKIPLTLGALGILALKGLGSS